MKEMNFISQFFYIIKIYLLFLEQIVCFSDEFIFTDSLGTNLFPKNMLYRRVNSEFSIKVEEKDSYKLSDQRFHLLLGSKGRKKKNFRPLEKQRKTGISTWQKLKTKENLSKNPHVNTWKTGENKIFTAERKLWQGTSQQNHVLNPVLLNVFLKTDIEFAWVVQNIDGIKNFLFPAK